MESIVDTFDFNIPVSKVIGIECSDDCIIFNFLQKTEFKSSFELVTEFGIGQMRGGTHKEGILCKHHNDIVSEGLVETEYREMLFRLKTERST